MTMEMIEPILIGLYVACLGGAWAGVERSFFDLRMHLIECQLKDILNESGAIEEMESKLDKLDTRNKKVDD